MIETINESKVNLIKAMIKFHGLVGKVGKKAKSHYGKYGDLNEYLEVIKSPLAECELLLIQTPVTNGLKTILLHTSGESIESEMTIPNMTGDPQKVGAILTYLRRYMIASFLGLNAEDTDADNTRPKTDHDIVSTKDKAQYKAEALKMYKLVREPNDKLQAWIAQIDTYDITALTMGVVRIKNLIKEQTK